MPKYNFNNPHKTNIMQRFVMAMLLTMFCIVSRAKVPLADPYIIYIDGTYYAYGTYSADGIIVFTSHDLKTWHKQGLALNKKDTSVPHSFWAPEVYRIGNEYLMYFTGNEHLYVAKSKSPLGPFVQTGSGPMLEEKAIDPSVFYDKKGKPYITFVRLNDGNNIWVAPLNKDMCSFDKSKMQHCFSVSQDWERDLGRVVEGPCVFRKGKTYYMIYSANDFRSQNYGLGLAISRKPEGPWQKRSDNPFLQRPDTLVGTGHNSFFTDKDGKLRIVFHAHDSHTKVGPRNMYIGTLEFADKTDKTHLTVGRDIIEAIEE